MSDRVFFDTNVLRYTVEEEDIRKYAIARSVSRAAIVSGTAVISYQVMQEFLNVGFKKFVPPMNSAQGSLYLSELSQDFFVVEWSSQLLRDGLRLKERYTLSWYDSLIVAAALSAQCGILYSEDGNHGQVIEGMTIVNPFI